MADEKLRDGEVMPDAGVLSSTAQDTARAASVTPFDAKYGKFNAEAAPPHSSDNTGVVMSDEIIDHALSLPSPTTVTEILTLLNRLPKSDAALDLLAEFCADFFLDHIGKLDPRWKTEIEAARIETRLDSWRLLGAWTARVLERGNHINTPKHPLFEAGAPRIVETKCGLPDCGKVFEPKYAGQIYCSNECGNRAFKLQERRFLAGNK